MSNAPRSKPKSTPRVRPKKPRLLSRTRRPIIREMIESRIRATRNMATPAAMSASNSMAMRSRATSWAGAKSQSVAMMAPIQAPTPRSSCTKPREKARRADSRSTARMMRSVKLIGSPSILSLTPALSCCRRRLGGNACHQILQMCLFLEFDTGRRRKSIGTTRGQDRTGEAKLCRFLQTQFLLTNRPDLARQANLSERDATLRHRPVAGTRDKRRGHSQVSCRLSDAQPADDVQINVLPGHNKATACFKHSQYHGEAPRIPADGIAPGGSARRGRYQRLHLHQEGTSSLHAGKDGRSCDVATAFSEKQLRGVRHFHQTLIGHFEDANLVSRPKAVFRCPQDAELMGAFTFEGENAVNHVFQHLGAGEHAVLGDMAHEQQAETAAFCYPDQFLRTCTHLGHGAGCGLQSVDVHCLNGIDDHQARSIGAIEGSQEVPDRGGGGQPHRGLGQPQAQGAQADLLYCLFAGDIDHLGLPREGRRRLEQQRRLADAGVATHQDRRTWDEAATADAVKLADARYEPRGRPACALERDEFDRPTASAGTLRKSARRAIGSRFLDDRVPGSAGVAASAPTTTDRAARLTDVGALAARHR